MLQLIFVHGIYSSRTIWDSPFIDHLVKLIGSDTQRVQFSWSGSNTVIAVNAGLLNSLPSFTKNALRNLQLYE